MLAILVGCGGADSEPGTLTCNVDGKTFEAWVPRDQLAAVRAHAERAGFAACRFEGGRPYIAHWAEPRRDLAGVVPRSPPTAPINVPPTALDNNRLRGSAQIVPEADTALEIERSGKDKVVGSFKLCVGVDGSVTSVRQLKSTGFAAYDREIAHQLEARLYAPYIYDGNPVPVCTAVTLVYTVPDP